MYTPAGSCPQCGAPLYVPQVWHAVTPPPVQYSCMCHAAKSKPTFVTTTNADGPYIQMAPATFPDNKENLKMIPSIFGREPIHDIGWAILQMKTGHRIAREPWPNIKYIYKENIIHKHEGCNLSIRETLFIESETSEKWQPEYEDLVATDYKIRT